MITIDVLNKKKKDSEKITMLTAYNYSIARILDETGIDIILVGDSLGMVELGYKTTLPVTIEEIIHHTASVTRAVKNSFVLADMPFLSYQVSDEEALKNAGRIIKETGANGVKIEGGSEVGGAVKKITDAGIPVCGHLGLTPQHINQLSGYKVQGKTQDSIAKLIDDALVLQKNGAFCLVLECVPEEVGKFITEKIKIPVIGIGAGKYCDGQVLVVNDMLGLTENKSVPKFVKKYADLNQIIKNAVMEYISEVNSSVFPEFDRSYHIEKSIVEKVEKL